MQRPDQDQALSRREAVLRAFLDADGRITQMPAKLGKRLVLLDHVAQEFEVGRTYPEKQVDAILRGFHDDYPALRRYLVEQGFLDRDHGVYWRSGGSVEL